MSVTEMDVEAELLALSPAGGAEEDPLLEVLGGGFVVPHQREQKISHREWNSKGVSGTLAEGSLVCFSNEEGLPLKVVKHPEGRYWELVPTHVNLMSESEEDPQHYLAPECVFTVLRKGERDYGFRSWAAEGRLLQATRNRREKPRVTNYNFHGWETWRLVGNTLQNLAWKTDLSAWNISEVRVQVLSMAIEREMKLKSEHREVRKALLLTEEKREEAEGQYKHAIQTCQKQMELAAQQTDELQARLAENLATNECLSTEVLEYQEINKRSHAAVARLERDVSTLETKERDGRRKCEALEDTLAEERAKAKERLRKQKEKSASENRKLKRQMEARLRELEEENEGLRKALDSIASKISQFSARNTPVAAARPRAGSASAGSGEGGFDSLSEGTNTPTLSAEEDGLELNREYPLEDDYPVDATLLTDGEDCPDSKIALIELDAEPTELTAREDPSDLKPEESAAEEERVVAQAIEGEGGKGEVGDTARESPSVQPSSTLESLGIENSESSDLFETSFEDEVQTTEVAKQAKTEVEMFKQQEPKPYHQESLYPVQFDAKKVKGGSGLQEARASAEMPFHKKTLGGGKRISALPPAAAMMGGDDGAEYENKFESEDWWNSFTMQSSLH
ncbi:hypothetical protein HOP50_01g05740 [Chloropicon primus]|nr:hypothetical protein A3770_01p05880 [Chloropicon primus]UPQ97283.1 hypothetical protein HOP50_01g05740 [Chloropicon primus]|eukprot:QDZ18070.1 hypothetical protein A3770_01p05880 [Chloropicon primus]